MKIETIYSVRGKMDCIRKGIGYIIHRPWLTTKVMGPWALLFACVYVIYVWCQASASVKTLLTGGLEMQDALDLFIFWMLSCVVYQLFTSRLFILFRRTQAAVERKEIEEKINEGEDIEAKEVVTLSLKERIIELVAIALVTLPYSIWVYILTCPFLGASEALYNLIISQPTVTRQGFVSLGIIIAFFVLVFFATMLIYPLYHSAMTVKNKRIAKADASFKSNIKIGFRHKGKIFIVTLLSSFITVLLCIIPCIPMVVCENAFSNSVTSILIQNDEAFIPTSGMWLMFIVCSITCAVIALISIIPDISLLYLYGSITEHEKSREVKTQ